MMYNTFNSRIYTTPITISNLLTQTPHVVSHVSYVDISTGVGMSLASIQQELLCAAASYNNACEVLADIKQGNTETGSMRTVEVLYACLRGISDRISHIRRRTHSLMLDAALCDNLSSEKEFYTILNYVNAIVDSCNVMSHGRFVMQLDTAVCVDMHMLERYLSEDLEEEDSSCDLED